MLRTVHTVFCSHSTHFDVDHSFGTHPLYVVACVNGVSDEFSLGDGCGGRIVRLCSPLYPILPRSRYYLIVNEPATWCVTLKTKLRDSHKCSKNAALTAKFFTEY